MQQNTKNNRLPELDAIRVDSRNSAKPLNFWVTLRF